MQLDQVWQIIQIIFFMIRHFVSDHRQHEVITAQTGIEASFSSVQDRQSANEKANAFACQNKIKFKVSYLK